MKLGAQDPTKMDYTSTLDEGYLFIMGPPEGGKTFAALQVSAHFDRKRLKMRGEELMKQEGITLDDVLHISVDRGALDGMQALRMKPHAINMLTLLDAHGIDSAHLHLAEIIKQVKADKPTLRYMIIDTVSALDEFFNEHCYDNMPQSTAGKDNTQQMWTDLAVLHTKYRQAFSRAARMNGMDSPIILSHATPKFKGEGSRATVAAKQMDAQNIIEGDMIPAITGKSGPAYVRNASMVLWCDYEVAPGQPATAREYKLYGDKQGVATKNRFRMLTGASWAADLGLTYDMIGRREAKKGA